MNTLKLTDDEIRWIQSLVIIDRNLFMAQMKCLKPLDYSSDRRFDEENLNASIEIKINDCAKIKYKKKYENTNSKGN